MVDQAVDAESDELLTTGEAAKLLSSSRQHVVNLCRSGELPFTTVGKHRRIRRRDLEAFRSRTQRMTRDQRRSLWLNTAVAGRLVMEPQVVLGKARSNLVTLEAKHPRGQAAYWLSEWRRLLGGPAERVVEVLTASTPYSREMRQNSPFAGVISQDERLMVLASFKDNERLSRADAEPSAEPGR
jgi:excisionase family DNA binding protein